MQKIDEILLLKGSLKWVTELLTTEHKVVLHLHSGIPICFVDKVKRAKCELSQHTDSQRELF